MCCLTFLVHVSKWAGWTTPEPSQRQSSPAVKLSGFFPYLLWFPVLAFWTPPHTLSCPDVDLSVLGAVIAANKTAVVAHALWCWNMEMLFQGLSPLGSLMWVTSVASTLFHGPWRWKPPQFHIPGGVESLAKHLWVLSDSPQELTVPIPWPDTRMGAVFTGVIVLNLKNNTSTLPLSFLLLLLLMFLIWVSLTYNGIFVPGAQCHYLPCSPRGQLLGIARRHYSTHTVSPLLYLLFIWCFLSLLIIVFSFDISIHTTQGLLFKNF